jgi:NAD+ kinase
MSAPRRIALLTHHRVEDTREAVGKLVQAVRAAGGEVLVKQGEADKHGLDELTVVADPAAAGVDAAVVLGGDGTMLEALRDYAGTGAPVFTFNFGAVGFLATLEPDQVDEGIRRLLEGDFETVELPTIAIQPAAGKRIAVNDVAFLRRSGSRVAQLAYAVRGEERTLVAATTDVLIVSNLSTEEPVDVETDGRRVCTLEPGQDLAVTYEDRPALLAKVSGTGFYDQLVEKFGRLAS